MADSAKEMLEINRRTGLTLTKCKDEMARIESFMSDLTVIFGGIVDKPNVEKARNSLTFFRFLESVLHLDELRFLLMTAHYISVIQILRYRLESMIQAVYLDQQHPSFSLDQKLCILKEISDKREYFVTRLLNAVSLINRENVRDLYKSLSKESHPSHLNFPTTEKMIEYLKDLETSTDCDKLKIVVNLVIQTYDVVFFLTLQVFEEAKVLIKSNSGIKKVVEKHNLTMLHKLL